MVNDCYTGINNSQQVANGAPFRNIHVRTIKSVYMSLYPHTSDVFRCTCVCLQISSVELVGIVVSSCRWHLLFMGITWCLALIGAMAHHFHPPFLWD